MAEEFWITGGMPSRRKLAQEGALSFLKILESVNESSKGYFEIMFVAVRLNLLPSHSLLFLVEPVSILSQMKLEMCKD